MPRITPCLWFDDQAEEAAKYYVSIFRNSKIVNIARYGEEGAKASGMPKGSVMVVRFDLDGQELMALNGGPVFKFTEAISLMVNCRTQKEIDRMWEKLSKGGDKKAQVCGWLKDKYGLSWQIVPMVLEEMMKDKDPERLDRVMKALVRMKKLNIEALKKAYKKPSGVRRPAWSQDKLIGKRLRFSQTKME